MFGYNIAKHPVLDQKMICLWSEEDHYRKSELKLLPGFGSNMCSFMVDGLEYLHQAPMSVIGTKFFGMPLLYPFPNRVRNCRFTFDGTEYHLPDNDGGRSLHGLIADVPFEYETPVVKDDFVSVTTRLDLKPGHPVYEQFPIANRLELTFTLKDDSVDIDIRVTNLDANKRFPFGFGVHPYFNVFGMKAQTLLYVPAKKWMEAVSLMPTGNLVDMDKAPADLSKPTMIKGLTLDEVWFGMDPKKPQSIIYEAINRKLVLRATEIFTHSVTYTPPFESFICVENQTNSTDCHNLYARGLEKESHLLILDPGKSISGTLQFAIEKL